MTGAVFVFPPYSRHRYRYLPTYPLTYLLTREAWGSTNKKRAPARLFEGGETLRGAARARAWGATARHAPHVMILMVDGVGSLAKARGHTATAGASDRRRRGVELGDGAGVGTDVGASDDAQRGSGRASAA